MLSEGMSGISNGQLSGKAALMCTFSLHVVFPLVRVYLYFQARLSVISWFGQDNVSNQHNVSTFQGLCLTLIPLNHQSIDDQSIINHQSD